jgi:hypothetical protein
VPGQEALINHRDNSHPNAPQYHREARQTIFKRFELGQLVFGLSPTLSPDLVKKATIIARMIIFSSTHSSIILVTVVAVAVETGDR